MLSLHDTVVIWMLETVVVVLIDPTEVYLVDLCNYEAINDHEQCEQ